MCAQQVLLRLSVLPTVAIPHRAIAPGLVHLLQAAKVRIETDFSVHKMKMGLGLVKARIAQPLTALPLFCIPPTLTFTLDLIVKENE